MPTTTHSQSLLAAATAVAVAGIAEQCTLTALVRTWPPRRVSVGALPGCSLVESRRHETFQSAQLSPQTRSLSSCLACALAE